MLNRLKPLAAQHRSQRTPLARPGTWRFLQGDRVLPAVPIFTPASGAAEAERWPASEHSYVYGSFFCSARNLFTVIRPRLWRWHRTDQNRLPRVLASASGWLVTAFLLTQCTIVHILSIWTTNGIQTKHNVIARNMASDFLTPSRFSKTRLRSPFLMTTQTRNDLSRLVKIRSAR